MDDVPVMSDARPCSVRPDEINMHSISPAPTTTGVPSATLEQCLRTGLSASQYGTVLTNPSGEHTILVGGNPNLNVETAHTFTLGLVWTPPSIPGLSAWSFRGVTDG